ncbi:MAG: alcohol dehydrogenase catalytic domain-containing protein [Candidatus Rokubacteria bacterium]|nr:alcohol dehydrogenase catalytic domain-containing protein [Candidatus Rokubacteria bacterium]
MLAVIKDPSKPGVVLEDVPVPQVGPWEVLVRVRAVGICGSDQRIYNDVNPARRRRFIIGHEIAGDVLEMGDRVREVAVGDRVGVEICVGCGICRHCKVGRVNLCEKLEEFGVTVDGGMTEYVAVPARNLHLLPPALSYEKAVLADPLACVIRGLEMIHVTFGSWVAILGPGQMGLLATQVVKRILRARVVMVGTRPDRLALARAMGADETVDVTRTDAVAAVRELTDGGADFVYEAAGTTRALDDAIAMARKGGTVVMLTVHRQVQINLEPAIRGELHLIGAICYSYREYARALGLLAEARIDVEPLLAHVFPLAQAQEAFDFVLSRQGIKAILTVPGEEAASAGDGTADRRRR